MKKIVLASRSPRRKELLEGLGYGDFRVVSLDCEEVYPSDLAVSSIAEYLSDLKASAYGDLSEDEILIAADTVVAFDDGVLGKPKDEAEAKAMLGRLSGRTHQVYTGVTLRFGAEKIRFTDKAEVTFGELSANEIDYYVSRYQPMDKAGSYGIQEWLGMAKIREIKGSFYTIMGLPTHRVYDVLRRWV